MNNNEIMNNEVVEATEEVMAMRVQLTFQSWSSRTVRKDCQFILPSKLFQSKEGETE